MTEEQHLDNLIKNYKLSSTQELIVRSVFKTNGLMEAEKLILDQASLNAMNNYIKVVDGILKERSKPAYKSFLSRILNS